MPSVFDHVHSMLTAGLVVRLDLPSPDGATESAAVRSNDRAQARAVVLRRTGDRSHTTFYVWYGVPVAVGWGGMGPTAGGDVSARWGGMG